MSYSLDKITTKAECDLVVQMANGEKEDLQHRKSNLQYQSNNFSDTSNEVSASLNSVQSELAALNTLVGSLPDGATKDANLVRKKRLELKEFLLQEKRDNYNVVALLEKELELKRLDIEIAEIDSFISQVNTRKAALQ